MEFPRSADQGTWKWMMISIRSEVDELERSHQMRRRAMGCYVAAIRNSADYAIDLENDLTEPHRKHLRALAEEVDAGGPEAVEESQATLRNLLRDYRDKGSHYLGTLREELAGATRALEEIMESLARADGESEVSLREPLDRLREASAITEIQVLRALALSSADAIESSVEEMRNQHKLAISQFQTEIRVLHRRIDSLERVASIDALTELLRRAEIERRIEQGMPECCILMIKTGGFHLAASQFHPDVAAELTGAFTKRLRNSLPPDAEIGRWGEDSFVAIMHAAKPDAVKAAKWIAEHLSGSYSCLLDGKTVRPSLQVSVAVMETGADAPRQILNRVEDFLPSK
jgi:GGDEF domain-containing protein